MDASSWLPLMLTSTAFSCPTFCRVMPWLFLLSAEDAWPNENKQNFCSEKQSHHNEQSETTTTFPGKTPVSIAESPPEHTTSVVAQCTSKNLCILEKSITSRALWTRQQHPCRWDHLQKIQTIKRWGLQGYHGQLTQSGNIDNCHITCLPHCS